MQIEKTSNNKNKQQQQQKNLGILLTYNLALNV
jgi:hypothetical protein